REHPALVVPAERNARAPGLHDRQRFIHFERVLTGAGQLSWDQPPHLAGLAAPRITVTDLALELGNQPMADNADVPQLSFEKALAELESIVQKLERGDVALEESVAIYERGEALKRRCEE